MKDSSAIYVVLAPDYYIARNFSANIEFNNDNLRPEYKDRGWAEIQRAISGRDFEKKRNGKLCTPHGALDKKPVPHPRLCFR